ncbi:hypothetical protein N9Z54_06290 [Planctomycetota bacterium]|nr:hypothetical protein [Planctomycetota bacterium]
MLKPDAIGALRLEPRAVVFDVDEELRAVVARGRSKADGPAVLGDGDAMLDSVLHQRLCDEGGDLRSSQLRRDVQLEPEAITEPQLLDFQVALGQLDLPGEGDELLWARVQGSAEEITDPGQGAQCLGGLLRPDHPADGVEGVEQEVGMELTLQRRELR